MTPIIDFHVHAGFYHELHPWVLDWVRGELKGIEDPEAFFNSILTPEGMVRYLRANGVDYAVALAELSPITTGTMPNEGVIELCRDVDCLIPFCNVNPFLVADLAGELERYVTEMGFRGLKLYPTYQHFYPNDSRLYPLYAKAEELGIPVMLHTGSSIFRGARIKYGDPLYLDDVAVDFPTLTLLLVHSGRGFWYDRAYFLTKLHANVYMEISGLPPQKLLTYFPELERVADKVIFGSDWPGMPFIGRNIELIRGLPLREETKVKILGGNAARILGIEDR
ncbi:MAG: amidohydrolase [Chloroflexi bacterium]|nr:MAG: metal-dependent hydrolase [Anaerolineaceae bacterium 4572_32.2]RLC71387.1 MAG: amidohydrolase [Chloroflexota bacterium]RLC76371.1 MAG: amidohydrolase [Chloroflexota bacterium]